MLKLFTCKIGDNDYEIVYTSESFPNMCAKLYVNGEISEQKLPQGGIFGGLVKYPFKIENEELILWRYNGDADVEYNGVFLNGGYPVPQNRVYFPSLAMILVLFCCFFIWKPVSLSIVCALVLAGLIVRTSCDPFYGKRRHIQTLWSVGIAAIGWVMSFMIASL